MNGHIFAVLVHERPEPCESLKRTLKELSVGSYSAKTCQEAGDLLDYCQPQIVFTESSVADGSWLDICNKVKEVAVPSSVIVVAAQPDPQLYMSVMERGAFDFVSPPFEREPLNQLIQSAAKETHLRREARVQAAFGW